MQQVTEEMIAAGRAVASGVDDTAFERIYLAMRSKDHSIAVDEVERVIAQSDELQLVVGAIAANLDVSDELLIELQRVGNLEKTARAIITAIGSQSIEGERADD